MAFLNFKIVQSSSQSKLCSPPQLSCPSADAFHPAVFTRAGGVVGQSQSRVQCALGYHTWFLCKSTLSKSGKSGLQDSWGWQCSRYLSFSRGFGKAPAQTANAGFIRGRYSWNQRLDWQRSADVDDSTSSVHVFHSECHMNGKKCNSLQLWFSGPHALGHFLVKWWSVQNIWRSLVISTLAPPAPASAIRSHTPGCQRGWYDGGRRTAYDTRGDGYRVYMSTFEADASSCLILPVHRTNQKLCGQQKSQWLLL